MPRGEGWAENEWRDIRPAKGYTCVWGGAGLLEKPIRGTHGFRLQMLRPCSLIENSADSFVFQLGEAKGGAGRLRETPPSHC